MTTNQIRIANNRAFLRYERFGVRLFRNVLREQAKTFDPQLMVDAYTKFYQYVFVDSAKRGYWLIRKQEAQTKDFQLNDFFLRTWSAWIKNWVLENQMSVISEVNENTLRKIREITAQGIEDGLNPSQLSNLLVKEIGSKSRALAIARTEATTANNMGALRSAEDWEIQTGTRLYKIWIHSSNKRDPRISHINAQSKPIPKEQPFNIGGVLMQYPGDKSAPLSELVNCGCASSYLSERLARKRFPKAFE